MGEDFWIMQVHPFFYAYRYNNNQYDQDDQHMDQLSKYRSLQEKMHQFLPPWVVHRRFSFALYRGEQSLSDLSLQGYVRTTEPDVVKRQVQSLLPQSTI